MAIDIKPINRVPVKLADGKSHTIYFPNRAFAEIERLLDVSFMEFPDGVFGMKLTPQEFEGIIEGASSESVKLRIGRRAKLSRVAVLLWAGLLHEESGLTVDGALELIDIQENLGDVMMAIISAYAAALGVEDKDDSAEVGDPKNPQGPESDSVSGGEESSSPKSTD